VIGGFTHPHKPPLSAGEAALAVLLSVPWSLLWVLGSIVHRFRVGTARMSARAIVETQAGQAQRSVGTGGPKGAEV